MPSTPIDAFELIVREMDNVLLRHEGGLVISTCQRVIVAIYSEDTDGLRPLDAYLEVRPEVEQVLTKYAEILRADEGFQYLVEVTCGLKSYVLGETQITHQMKEAYINSCAQGILHKELNRIFQDVFRVSSRIQSETQVPLGKVSVLSLIEDSIHQFTLSVPDLLRVAIIGTGEMARKSAALMSRLVPESRIDWYTDREKLLEQSHHYRKEVFPSHISSYDVVFIATPKFSLTPQEISQNTQKPCLYVDLTLPRTLPSPPQGSLYTVITLEALQSLSDRNRELRQASIQEARKLISDYLAHRRRRDILKQHQEKILNFRQKLQKVALDRKKDILNSLHSKDIERRLEVALNAFLHHAQQEYEALIVEVYK